MLASYSEYMHKKAALEQYRAQYPDDAEAAAKVQAALAAYEAKNGIAADDPKTAQAVSALNAPTEGLPSQEEISQRISHDAPVDPTAARVSALVDQLDAGFSLPPQALAIQPATTHPAGDAAAEDEWVRGDLDNPNGRVIVYDAPLKTVQEELAKNPNLLAVVGQSISPGARIEKGDSIEQAYQEYKWKQTADAAAKAGKTAYRYSKASYLGDGKNAGLLDSLSTKVKAAMGPAMEGATAFVLGVDDTANLGAIRAGSESSGLGWGGTLSPEQDAELRKSIPEYGKQKPAPSLATKGETVGGPPEGESLRQRNARIEEEHPDLHTAGQVVGAVPGLVGKAASKVAGLVSKTAGAAIEQGTKSLAEWQLSNGLWDAITGGAKAAERSVLNSTARGTAAAATDQALREGVQAASRYAETGDTGTTLGEAAGHASAAAGGGLALHMLGGLGRKATSAFGENVRWGPRYEGAPGRLEEHGLPVSFGRGHVAPQVVKDADLRGRKEGGRTALTVLASDLDQPLGDVQRGRVAKAERAEARTVAAHQQTPEAGYTLPARNLAETSVEKLRELTSPVPKKGRPGVGKPGSESEVKGILNKNIEGVSTRKTAHGIPLTADEARSFLSPEWQETGKLDFEQLGKKKGPVVWVTPRRHDSAHFDTAMEELSTSKDKQVKSMQEAARKDRAARGTGEYGAARDKHDKDIGKAKKGVKRIGADKDDGVRDTVVRVGKSKGNDKATSALRSAARGAGPEAREQLRGALVAEDLDDLRRKASLGGGARNPLASPWNLWGLGDKAVLRTGYPIARHIERMAPGKAGAAYRLGAAAVRNDSKDDERAKNAPHQPGSQRVIKRRTPRRIPRRQEHEK